jgi:hypothetical protein
MRTSSWRPFWNSDPLATHSAYETHLISSIMEVKIIPIFGGDCFRLWEIGNGMRAVRQGVTPLQGSDVWDKPHTQGGALGCGVDAPLARMMSRTQDALPVRVGCSRTGDALPVGVRCSRTEDALPVRVRCSRTEGAHLVRSGFFRTKGAQPVSLGQRPRSWGPTNFRSPERAKPKRHANHFPDVRKMVLL